MYVCRIWQEPADSGYTLLMAEMSLGREVPCDPRHVFWGGSDVLLLLLICYGHRHYLFFPNHKSQSCLSKDTH